MVLRQSIFCCGYELLHYIVARVRLVQGADFGGGGVAGWAGDKYCCQCLATGFCGYEACKASGNSPAFRFCSSLANQQPVGPLCVLLLLLSSNIGMHRKAVLSTCWPQMAVVRVMVHARCGRVCGYRTCLAASTVQAVKCCAHTQASLGCRLLEVAALWFVVCCGCLL